MREHRSPLSKVLSKKEWLEAQPVSDTSKFTNNPCPLLPIDLIYQVVVTGSSIWGAKMDCQQGTEALKETDHLQHSGASSSQL